MLKIKVEKLPMNSLQHFMFTHQYSQDATQIVSS